MPRAGADWERISTVGSSSFRFAVTTVLRVSMVGWLTLAADGAIRAQEATPLSSFSVEPETEFVSDLPADRWWDNLSLFAGIDGSKQPQDLGINALLGGRLSANLGAALIPDCGLGLQLGAGYNFSDSAVGVLDQLDPTVSGRSQLFTTAGLFQRFEGGGHWALAHDFLFEDYYDNFALGQFRGDVGAWWDDVNQFGAWGTVGTFGDSGSAAGTPVSLRPLTQANVYWRHVWQSCAETRVWGGLAESHGEVVHVFPANPVSGVVPIIGAAVFAPLNDYLAIYGETNLIMPADSGTVDAYLGIAFYPGGGVHRSRSNCFAPVLPVANNTSFAVDLRR